MIGAEAGKIVDVGIVAAGAEAETEVGTTTEIPVMRGGTANTDTNTVRARSGERDPSGIAAEAEKGAVRARSGERDPGGVAAEAEKGAVRVLGRETAALQKNVIAMRNKAVLKIQVTKRKLEALTI